MGKIRIPEVVHRQAAPKKSRLSIDVRVFDKYSILASENLGIELETQLAGRGEELSRPGQARATSPGIYLIEVWDVSIIPPGRHTHRTKHPEERP